MKLIFFHRTITVLIFAQVIFISNVFAQKASDWLFSGQFNVSYSEKVRVQVGNVAEDKTKKELHSGTKVGTVSIDPETISKMEAATGTHFKIEIKKIGIGDLRDIFLTNIEQNQKIKGLYNVKSHKFIFGSTKSEGTENGKCGKRHPVPAPEYYQRAERPDQCSGKKARSASLF